MTRAWFEADDRLYRHVATFLSRDCITVDSIAGFAGSTLPTWRKLGFGASRMRAACRGGAATASVDAIVFDERIAQLAVSVTWSAPNAMPKVRTRFLRALGTQMELVESECRAHVSRRDDETLAMLHAARTHVLGPVPARDIPPALRDALGSLVMLGNEHLVGDRCGYAAKPAPGSLETDALVDARRADLLGDVLRGPNPEARVYAARALLAAFRDELDDATRVAIAEIRDLEIPIRTCSGAEQWDALAAELVLP